ncbi:unnamed protein product [Rotaria sp. Silwood1]|nr:unnamed protein product [Rotaria sp. Silwood1]
MGTPLVMIVLAVLLLRSVRNITQRRVVPKDDAPPIAIIKGSDLQCIDSRLTLMLFLQLIIAITTRVPYAVQLVYINITQSWPKSPLRIAIENVLIELIHLLSYTFFASSFYVSFITNRDFRRKFKNFFRKLLIILHRREIN